MTKVVKKVGIITPEWPAPENVRAAITTRIGGASQPPYNSFNLATHVGDDRANIDINRRQLRQQLNLPSEPQWLNQTHGVEVLAAQTDGVIRDADGCFSHQPKKICLVQTADCLPVLLCNREGTEVAAIHAGWRGLAAGIVAKGVATFTSNQLMAYLGPAISQAHFEVGADVLNAFLQRSDNFLGSAAIVECFHQTDEQHWMADIYGLARLSLQACGVTDIFGGEYCSYADRERFYSYRRDGVTGRMATLIWRQ